MKPNEARKIAIKMHKDGHEPDEIAKALFKDHGYISMRTGKAMTASGIRQMIARAPAKTTRKSTSHKNAHQTARAAHLPNWISACKPSNPSANLIYQQMKKLHLLSY